MDTDLDSPIKNCDWTFAFQCPRVWGRLKRTTNEDLRYCDTCMKEVHLVKSDEQAAAAAKQGLCVAIDPTIPEGSDDDIVLGLLEGPGR